MKKFTRKTMAMMLCFTVAFMTMIQVTPASVVHAAAQTVAFKDVQDSDWFAGDVQTARKLELVDGMEDGAFKPQSLVMREQMAVMIERALSHLDARPQVQDVYLASRYRDAGDIGGWAKESMTLLVAEKLMEGVAADQLAPKKTTSRVEAVILLERFLQHAKLINE